MKIILLIKIVNVLSDKMNNNIINLYIKHLKYKKLFIEFISIYHFYNQMKIN